MSGAWDSGRHFSFIAQLVFQLVREVEEEVEISDEHDAKTNTES